MKKLIIFLGLLLITVNIFSQTVNYGTSVSFAQWIALRTKTTAPTPLYNGVLYNRNDSVMFYDGSWKRLMDRSATMTQINSRVTALGLSKTHSSLENLTWATAGHTGFQQGALFSQTVTANDSARTIGTVETTLTAAGGGSLSVEANHFTVGKFITIKASGYINTSTTCPLTTIKISLGGTVLGSVTDSIGHGISLGNWEFVYNGTCRTTGATGTIIGQGYFTVKVNHANYKAVPEKNLIICKTWPVSINTTIANKLYFTVQYSANTAGNNIACTNLIMKTEY
jgi:hypothetical protein